MSENKCLISPQEKQAIEKIISSGKRAEIFKDKNGIRILQVKREEVKTKIE